MARIEEIDQFVRSLLGPSTEMPGEYGVTQRGSGDIERIGVATNLSPETVELAVAAQVDLLLTHHDAWDFLYGMKDVCVARMAAAGISHLFAHVPLDAADLGTVAALGQALGGRVVGRFGQYEGYRCGRAFALAEPTPLGQFVARMERVSEERVQVWRNGDADVRRFGVISGGGILTEYVREAVGLGCGLYITGEKSLYTVQYARFAGIHLIVGSHTYTEIQGVRALAERIAEALGVETVRLAEPHLESGPLAWDAGD